MRLVRENSNRITLAIGDGANDVSMIQVSFLPLSIPVDICFVCFRAITVHYLFGSSELGQEEANPRP